MSFNLDGALSGLMGAAGREAGNQAARLHRLEEKQLEEKIWNRRQNALLQKEMILAQYMDRISEEKEGRAEERAIYAENRADSRKVAAEGRAENRQLAKEGRAEERAVAAEGRAEERQIAAEERELDHYGTKQGILAEAQKEVDDHKQGNRERSILVTAAAAAGKPEYKPGEARKEIANVEKAIAKINAESNLSEESLKDFASIDPVFASFMGGSMKEMNPEDKKRAIAALEEYRRYLYQFVGENQKTKSGKSGKVKTVSTGENKKPDEVSSFIQDSLKG